MSNKHILHLLEEDSFAHLSAAELTRITTHTANCQECLHAYEAARLAFAILQERSAVTVEPSPFFQTRVLAAIRERQQATEVMGLSRMWQMAKTLLASMAILVVLLTSFTMYSTDDPFPERLETSISFSADPVDLVIYGQDGFNAQEITYSQAFSDIYEWEVEDSNGK